MAHLAVSVLGPLQVMLNHKPVTHFATDKTRALLVYLAVEAHRPHHRASLTHLFWPDLPEQEGRQNLRRTLHRLRQAIDDSIASPPFLLITHQTIQFNHQSNLCLDLADFQAGVRRAGLGNGQSFPDLTSGMLDPQAIALLQQTIHLYQGDFLAEPFRSNTPDFEAWVLAIREDLQIQARMVLAHLTLHALHHGAAEQAAQYARSMVALDPLHEASQRLCMYVLAQLGERPAAIARYELLRQMLHVELGIEPEAATTMLYQRICDGSLIEQTSPVVMQHAASPSTASPVWNLPTQLTPFFGREQELTRLATLLQQPAYRLITLLGPGGIGKTRLALQAAALHRHTFRHGVCFVALLDVASPEGLAAAIVDALNLPHLGTTPAYDQLCTYLRDKEILLLLDNLEHLSDVTDLLLDLLRHAPGLLFLVTSRRRLGVQAEDVFPVQGLALPATDDMVQAALPPAVQLFYDRARRVQKQFQIDAQTLPAILRICRLVDGLPLAIELAAAWVRVRSCADIAHDLEEGLDSLSAGWHDIPVRHRSIRAMFDHSWSMLIPEEQRVLCALAVFHGGCTTSAAHSIIGTSPAIMAGLVDKSFVWLTPDGRYVQHSLAWQYAREKLEAAHAEYGQMYERHASYYARFLQACNARLKGQEEMQAMADIEADIENIRTAWFWAVDQEQVTVFQYACASLLRYYEMRGNYREGERLFAAAAAVVQRADPLAQGLCGQLLTCRGLCAIRLGDYQQAEALLQQSLALLPTDRYAQERTYALHYISALDCLLGKFDHAHPKLQECLTIARSNGDQWEYAYALMTLGLWHALVGIHHTARQYYEESLQVFNTLGEQRYAGRVQGLLGATLYVLGHAETARQYLNASLRRLRDLHDSPQFSSIQIQIMFSGSVEQGNYADLVFLAHEIMASARNLGDDRVYTRTLLVLADVAHMQGDTPAEEMHLRMALRLAHTSQVLPHALMALIRFARLLGHGDTHSRIQALELLAYALQHPVTYQGDRQSAQQLLAELEPVLPQDIVSAARQRGQESSLERLVDMLLTPAVALELLGQACVAISPLLSLTGLT